MCEKSGRKYETNRIDVEAAQATASAWQMRVGGEERNVGGRPRADENRVWRLKMDKMITIFFS